MCTLCMTYTLTTHRCVTTTEMEDMSVMHHLNLSSEFAQQMQRCGPWLDADMVQRFLDACRGDEHKALQRIKATVVRKCKYIN